MRNPTTITTRAGASSAVAARVLTGLVGLVGLAGLAACTDDGGDPAAVTADFCTNVEAFEALQAEGDALFESTAEVPVEQLRDVFSRFRDAVQALTDTAPDAVAADAALVGATTDALIDAYERADFDFVVLATDPQYAEVLAGLDDDQITEANDRLATFFREECDAG
jgi:hypothetical protein